MANYFYGINNFFLHFSLVAYLRLAYYINATQVSVLTTINKFTVEIIELKDCS